MQQPTIGSSVHYQSFVPVGSPEPSVCQPAIVTAVDGEVVDGEFVGHLDLVVFTRQDSFFNWGTSHTAERHPGTWHWPAQA
ncbi:hypothetical protein ACIBJE_02015 [Micromonospora sp. NPDC050187]|uniref:hypothetical protein n=1 Tax=Micromonospora sp. NPDC050187 TaxID=3364277 RepID=UPI00378D8E12